MTFERTNERMNEGESQHDEYLGNEILIHELIKIKKHSIEISTKRKT